MRRIGALRRIGRHPIDLRVISIVPVSRVRHLIAVRVRSNPAAAIHLEQILEKCHRSYRPASARDQRTTAKLAATRDHRREACEIVCRRKESRVAGRHAGLVQGRMRGLSAVGFFGHMRERCHDLERVRGLDQRGEPNACDKLFDSHLRLDTEDVSEKLERRQRQRPASIPPIAAAPRLGHRSGGGRRQVAQHFTSAPEALRLDLSHKHARRRLPFRRCRFDE